MIVVDIIFVRSYVNFTDGPGCVSLRDSGVSRYTATQPSEGTDNEQVSGVVADWRVECKYLYTFWLAMYSRAVVSALIKGLATCTPFIPSSCYGSYSLARGSRASSFWRRCHHEWGRSWLPL